MTSGYRILAAIILFVLWSLFAAFIGWKVRDGSANTVVAQAATAQQSARADQAEHARATDHVDAQTASRAEQQRVETSRAHEVTFHSIEQRATQYANANHDPGSACDLDGDGLRAWREANAGAVDTDPEPGHPGGTAGLVSGRPAAAGER